MKKGFLYLILIVVALQYGYSYITSDDFQKYGDQTKAQWTCQANNTLGFLTLLGDNPSRAFFYYSKTAARCPATSEGYQAILKMAECYGYMGKRQEAMDLLQNFIEQNKQSPLVGDFQKQLDKIAHPASL